MKIYMFICMLSSLCLLQASDKKERLLQTSEIDYSKWVLHRTNRTGGIHVEEYILINGPLQIPQQPLLMRLFACCCAKHLHEKHVRKHTESYTFAYDQSTSTIQRFYPYKGI